MTSQFAFDFPHRPAFGADDFLVAPSNEEAIAWLDRWPAWPAAGLVVHGAPGAGKTHLAHVWEARAGAAICPGEALTAAQVPSLAARRAVIVEGAERAAERPLLHLVNLIAEGSGHVLLTAEAPAARWNVALADLRSRLLALPSVELRPPDEALIGAVLLKLFADRQLVVGQETVLFLLRNMDRSFATARRLVAALDHAALAEQRRITIPLARGVLEKDAAPPD